MEEETYEVPSELEELLGKSIALNDLRDRYVRIPLGFKKARKLAIESEQLRRKFWIEIRKLYPELSSKRLVHTGGFITIDD